ncbi:MAG TPA: hypothetical protein VN823_27740 [Stellaceae bacterium]|nr:hypothetical protein [Stellaceae bacterium]
MSGATQRIDFGRINAAALAVLPALLARWLPQGRLQGREYVALNPRRNDRSLGSFRINVSNCRWADFAVEDAHGGDATSLLAYLSDVGQVEAARRLSAMLGLEEGGQ